MVLQPDPDRKKRLIVLIPDGLSGNLELARKIYWMALRNQYKVLYLTLVDDAKSMRQISLNMASINAATSNNFLVVNSMLIETNLWLSTLSEIYQPGDLIVCQKEQTVKHGFLRTMPIDEFLQIEMNAHVLTVSGFYHPQQTQIRMWVEAGVAWLGFIIILAVFSILEIRFDHQLHGLLKNIVVIAALILEFSAVLAWNNYNSQDKK